MKSRHWAAFALACLILAGPQRLFAQIQGPSTGSTPYVLPTISSYRTISVLTTDNTGANPDDSVGGYFMAGIPDGLGAFDNGNGTFTLLMNHELSSGGAVRAHGANGAFVSEWTIDKNTLAVTSGADLMQQVFQWNSTTQSLNASPTAAVSFSRFCSADLPAVSALSFQGLGTTDRIFMHGEEGGNGWQQATVVNGPEAGNSYTLGKFDLNTNGSAASTLSPVQLNVTSASTGSPTVTFSGAAPRELAVGGMLLGQRINTIAGTTITLAGNANANIGSSTPTDFTLGGIGNWENALASPFAQQKTVVVANSDGGTGLHTNALSVYVGTKTSTGTDADKAGLTNGVMKFVSVAGNPLEIINNTTRATSIANGTAFTLSATASTQFSRPEDGAWNPLNPSQYYFVTTDQLDQASDGVGGQIGQTRLWRLTFNDITNPDAGGVIDLLINGRTVGGKKVNMFDNITVAQNGHVILEEDVGNAAHNGKMWDYDPVTDGLQMIAMHDPNRFGDIGKAATSPFTADEETSGVIDITAIMAGSALNTGVPGEAWYLSSDQAHYTTGINSLQVEGGQLFAIHVPEPSACLLAAVGAVGVAAYRVRRRRRA